MPCGNSLRRCGALVLAAWGASVHSPAAVAQSTSGFEPARTSLTPAREYVAGESIPIEVSLPSNVVVSESYRALLESMLRGSATFRRQCLRIAGEPLLTVSVGLAPHSWPSSLRATTRVTRLANGRMSAQIAISPPNDVVELIAHEFEHVIEQIDGIDLAARAALPRTGVHRHAAVFDAFETVRATRVGQRVTAEFQP